MKIKTQEQDISYLDMFDVIGAKETNLVKILAYILAKDERAFRKFLEILNIEEIKNIRYKNLLANSSIEIEVAYNAKEIKNDRGGRTDIEITIDDPKIFIIIESKVNANKATIEQYKLYKPIYNLKEKESKYKKYFIFLSHQSGINIIENEDIEVIDLDWRQLINALSEASDASNETELQSFLNYYERSYGMSNQKEILIQDISADREIERLNNCVYRRGKTNGSPLYFAPHFTKPENNKGIHQISKILGVITIQNITWQKVQANCIRFAEIAYPNSEEGETRKELLKLWETDVINTGNYFLENPKDGQVIFTYYFLSKPVKLSKALQKDESKGGGKNWIARNVPKNRCVTFADFIEHSILSVEYNGK